MYKFALLLVACLAMLPVRCLAEDKVPVRDPRRFPADLRALHSLRDEFASVSNDGSDAFLRRFWKHSGRVARARGPAILYALMEEAHQWKDEEILAYHSLIFQLKRRPTLRIFAAYERADPSTKPFFEELRGEMARVDEARRK